MEYPAKISGFRSRPINGIIDAGRAARPLGGAGITVREGADGSVVSADARAVAGRLSAFAVRVVRDWAGSAGSRAYQLVQVCVGRVFEGVPPVEVPFAPGDGADVLADDATGLPLVSFPLDGAASVCVRVSGEGDGRSFSVGAAGDPESDYEIEIASVGEDGTVAQRVVGDIYIGAGGHFGDAEGAQSRDTWSVADGRPAILDAGEARVLVDSRGNIISWTTSGGGGGDPDDPRPPEPAPPCGNPLNADDDYHPLAGGGASASDGEDDDYNPLNYEGPGGFTPTCAG